MSKRSEVSDLHKMWLNNPRCAICGIVTIPNARTAGHIYPKSDIRRYLCSDFQLECFKCNNGKCAAENLQTLPKLRRDLLKDLISGEVFPVGIDLFGRIL